MIFAKPSITLFLRPSPEHCLSHIPVLLAQPPTSFGPVRPGSAVTLDSSYRCSLLALFSCSLSFVFNHLQPLLPKTGGWVGVPKAQNHAPESNRTTFREGSGKQERAAGYRKRHKRAGPLVAIARTGGDSGSVQK